MRGKVATVSTVAAILAFPIAGCGGDDSTIQSIATTATTDATTSSVASDEFITAADARCAEANSAIANLSTDPAASTTSTQQQLAITKQTLSALRALGAPEDPDGSLADFYSAMQDQISVLKQQGQALAGGDTAAADALDTQLTQAQNDAETAASSFGLEECGQQGSSLSSGTSTTTTSPGAATPTTTTPVPAPVTPTPAPPATGGTGGTGGTGTGTPTPGGGGGGGSSGGISPSG
jgi:hypothetical protein